MASFSNNPKITELMDWVKKNVQAEAFTPEFSNNLNKTHKATLAQYLRQLAENCEQLNAHLHKADAAFNKQKKQLLRLQHELEENRQRVQELENRLQDKNQAIADEHNKVSELKKDLDELDKKNKELYEDLQAKDSLLDKMSRKSMESVLAVLPDWLTSGTNWKEEYSKLNFERNRLTEQFKNIQDKLKNALHKHKKEQQRNNSLEGKIQALTTENDRLAAQLAKSDKTGERIGDYEKRENYQIVREYKEFCLRQGLDFIAEEILNCKQQAQENFNEDKYKNQMAEMKSILAGQLIVNPYNIQVRNLRRQTRRLDFTSFKNNHLADLLAALAMPEQLNQELLKIAEKAFQLIHELITVQPPCQLLLPEIGECFDATEHDIDDVYCRPEGQIKFILAPGVYSGHEILMKPVVYTR